MTDDTAKELRNIILATQDMLNNLDNLLELICLAGAGIGNDTGKAIQRGTVLAQEELQGALACLQGSRKLLGGCGMIVLDQLRDVSPAGNAESLACVVVALIGTARLALENDTSGQHAASNVATVLGLTEQLASMLVDTCEVLTRDPRQGVSA